MEPSLIDPHNHVPEVTPDDVWGDAEGLHPNFNATATVLPPKRMRVEGSPPVAPGRAGEGLRIESKAQRREAEEDESQLEVQEIDGNVVRLNPELPSVPRMPRQITFHERPVKDREKLSQRGEGKEWGITRRQSFRWILGTGAGVATIVVVAMMLLPLVNKSNAARPRPGQGEIAAVSEEDLKEADELNDLLSRQPEAEQVFRKYASAMIVDDVLPLLRDAESVEPLVRQRFRPGMIPKSWVPPEDTLWNVFGNDSNPYGLLEVTLPDFSKFKAYMTLINNQLHLDWKASTGYGTATFAELGKNQGDPSEIRAEINPVGFYTAVFPEAEFQSYQFVSPDGEQAIWCYARRGEQAEADLTRLFHQGEILKTSQEPRKVTLRLAHAPAGALPNQWMIAELLHKDWIIPPSNQP